MSILPRTRIAWLPNRRTTGRAQFTEVEIVVRRQRTGDQILGIQNRLVGVTQQIGSQRTDVMDDDLPGDRTIGTSKIASVVSCDHQIPDAFPLTGRVEPLIHPSLMSKGRSSYRSRNVQVSETAFEVRNLDEIRIASIR